MTITNHYSHKYLQGIYSRWHCSHLVPKIYFCWYHILKQTPIHTTRLISCIVNCDNTKLSFGNWFLLFYSIMSQICQDMLSTCSWQSHGMFTNSSSFMSGWSISFSTKLCIFNNLDFKYWNDLICWKEKACLSSKVIWHYRRVAKPFKEL